jgi:tRNA 2-thiouridine synthesizing protein A
MGLFGKKKESSAGDGVAPASITLDDGSSITPAQVVDCIGDSCPRPQLMTKKAVDKAGSGDVIEVRVDNSTSMEAIPPMMPSLNSRHLGTVKSGNYWSVLVSKN